MFIKRKTKLILIFLLFISAVVVIAPSAVLAQNIDNYGVNDLTSVNLGTRGLKDTIALIINIFLGFLGVIATGLIIYAGFLWMTAGGEEDKIADAKKIMTNAVIGLAVILSAYAITAFIISRLSSATGVPGGPGGPGDPDIPDLQRQFRVTSILPRGQQRIRNVVPQISFSQVINPALIDENNVLTNQEGIRVERANGQGGFERVAGTLTIDPNNQQRVKFTPQTNCPEPNERLFCFGYDENNADLNLYRVTVLSEAGVSLRSVGGLAVTCNGNSCVGEFRVGGLVDTQNPSVDFTEAVNRAGQHFDLTGRAIFSLDEVYNLFAQATDDGGLTSVDFFVAGNFLNTNEAGQDTPLEFLAQTEWPTNNLQPQAFELTTRAYDAAGHESALGRASVLIRPAHCFNNIQDENFEETGVDCGGACGACAGDPCGEVIENRCTDADNQICASNVCNVDSCLCQQPPRIMAVSPDNGAKGNWVTISGRGFGNTPGQIFIGDVEGRLPRFCQASWTDTQIILELPIELDLGNTQLSVITSQNLTSNRVDFSVNDIERPGICMLVPDQNPPGANFTLVGYQFGNINDPNQEKSVYFGRAEQNLAAAGPVWRAVEGRAFVSANLPNLNPGQTSVRVRIDGQDSNALAITVLPENNYPNIVDFEPKNGNVGQYVNIYGSDFGQYQEGQSKVIFTDNVEGTFDFPVECRADSSFWQDDHIIVKVPEGAADGTIMVQRADGRQDTTDQSFDYQAEADLAPGICSLYPREGQVGSTFEVAGEYFNGGTLKLGEQNLNARPDNQNQHFNNVPVPEGARSGPVKVVINNELQSNSLDFSVTGGAGGEEESPDSYYQWQFTTCENCVVPEVVESQSCQLGLASPTPLKNSLNNFVNTQISATFNTDMNNASFDLGSTVVVKSCGNGETPGNCAQVQNIDGEFEFGQGNSGEYFVLSLSSALQPSTWYQVTLGDLRSEQENLAMAEPYVWFFKTRDNNEVCQINAVSVNPNQRLIRNNNPVYLNDEVTYSGYPYNAENCNICPDTFSWSWNSSNPNQAEIDTESRVNQSLMTAKAITQSPVNITAQASNDEGQSGQGTAQVEIVPRDFGILFSQSCSIQPQSPSPYPSYQNACLNAKIAVQFNSIITDGLLAADALTLKQRGNNQTVAVTMAGGIYYEAGGRNGLRGVIFESEQNLLPNTWYEVSLNNNLANVDGGQFIGARSWQFKTQSGNELCQFNTVLVIPGTAILQPQESQNYSAETVDRESCQLLKEPNDLRWSWLSENETVAEVGQSNNHQNSALAKEIGETKIRAQALGEENTGNNGKLTVSQGEDIYLTITQHHPSGENVCQNALGQVRFNLGINQDLITPANFIVVEHGNDCPEAGCAVLTDISFNQDKTIISLLPQENNNLWKQQTRYEIKIRGNAEGIKTADEEELAQRGCGQGMIWDAGTAACSWSFTVGQNRCEVAAIEVTPASATINIGTWQEWSAYAVSAEGELLSDPIENWRTANANIATVDFSEGDTSRAQSRGIGEGETVIAAIIGNAPPGTASIRVNDILNGPAITGVVPQDGAQSVCRNAMVKVDFDKLLNKDTVKQNNFQLEYQVEAASQPAGCREEVVYHQNSGNWLSADNLIGQWLNNLAGKIFSSLWNSLFNRAQAVAYWCPVAGQWLEEHAGGQSQVYFSLTQALPVVSTVRATVVGGENGVKAVNGQPLAGNFSYSFRTGPDVCDLDFVTVAADQESGQKDWTFTTSFDNETDNNVEGENAEKFDTIYDGDKKYTASGFSQTGEQLAAIAGVYEWNWQWQTSNQSVAALDQSGPGFMVVKAQNKNGQSNIIASAVFPAVYQKPALSASAKAIVDICENRWNPITGDLNPDYKFIDPTYNFSLSYCRDAGGAGTMDDLPALFEPQPLDISSDNDPAKDDLLREYLIPVPTTGDVLGLRVYKNNLHLNPRAWYQKNINAAVQGNPSNTEVDGYEAIQDGRTVYVAAANVPQGSLSYNSDNNPVFVKADGWLANLWQGLKNVLADLSVNNILAAVAPPGTPPVAAFQQNFQNFNVVANRFANEGFRPADLAGAQADLNQARADYNRAALVQEGVSPQELNAYEAQLANLAADLTRYQGLVNGQTDLQNLLNELNRLQITGQQADRFIADFNNFNQGLSNGLQTSDLTDFEKQLDALQANADDLAGDLNVVVPNFNANDFRVINVGYRVNRINNAYTNIYLLSYNQNASPKTMEIVKRLMAKWQFNSNIDNPDLKEKLRRDVKRLADLTAVTQTVEAYQAGHNGAVPALTAGSFLSGRSNSKWPSWNQTLAPALSASLPVDPINKFNKCVVCTEPELVNAGFEDPNDLAGPAAAGDPGLNDESGWRLTLERAGLGVSHNTNRSFVKEGSASLGILSRNAQTGIVQPISLLPNTTYELSAWVYVVSGRAHLTFDGNDYGNEWLTPPDVTGWVLLKNRLVTNPAVGGGANGSNNFIFIRSHEGAATFYVDQATIQTQGGNCGYDRQTCWNPDANQSRGAFACDADSYFYSYETIGNNNYLLAAKMETTATWLSDQDQANRFNPHFRLSTAGVLGCNTQPIGARCGDGVVNGNEQCEPGMSNNYCPAGARWYTPRYLGCEAVGSKFGECTWVNPDNYGDDWDNLSIGQRCGGYCGDGILNSADWDYQISPAEQCDISAEAGADGFSNGVINGSDRDNQYACSASCRDIGGWCGDNIVQSFYGEQCDGNANGWSCQDGSTPSCNNNTCGVSCDSGGAYYGRCGDGYKQPEELCDGQIGVSQNNYCANSCQLLRCLDGYDACIDGGSVANGCETNIAYDINHCGRCGHRCPQPAHSSAVCSAVRGGWGCSFNCNDGYHREGDVCVASAECGNDVIEVGEACDDGPNNGNGNYCRADCSGFDLGQRIFLDNFDDAGVYSVPTGESWLAREHGNFEPAVWSIVQLNDDNNPFTLQGANPSDGDPQCGSSDRWFLKALVPPVFDVQNQNQNVTIVSRIKIKQGNPNTLILGNYDYNAQNAGQESAYALWPNINNQHRLSLVKVNRMDEHSGTDGVMSVLDQFSPVVENQPSLVPSETWYWLAMKISHSGNRANIKYIDWQDGEAMPAVADWHNATDNDNALNGRTFGVAVWGDCSTSWYDDFQVYIP
ncbi:MAG: Ig-like domain-containing protein [Candidatus Komeilibacteria bacterium]|nr:Ig-like domain-containing protein [Candidatus Komeilibacteria bacterium]